MKKISFIFVFFIISSLSFGQNNPYYIPFFNWSNPITFQISPAPYITGFGVKSDSISKANNNKTFYKAHDGYYEISTWADYYYWHVKKYWYQWLNPELYELLYQIDDDDGMARYVATHYNSSYYPTRVIPTAYGRVINPRNINRYAMNDRQVMRLSNQNIKLQKQHSRESIFGKVNGKTNMAIHNNNPTPNDPSAGTKVYTRNSVRQRSKTTIRGRDQLTIPTSTYTNGTKKYSQASRGRSSGSRSTFRSSFSNFKTTNSRNSGIGSSSQSSGSGNNSGASGASSQEGMK